MGRFKTNKQCPRCSSKDVILQDSDVKESASYVCTDCDYEFTVGISRSKKLDDKHKSDYKASRREMSGE